MTGDMQNSLDKLKPVEFYPWASRVPGRGYTKEFKRHKTVGHAHAALPYDKAERRDPKTGKRGPLYTSNETVVWMWKQNAEAADPTIGEWVPYEVWRDGQYVQIATKSGQTECHCKSGEPVFVANDPFLESMYGDKVEGVWCSRCYTEQVASV